MRGRVRVVKTRKFTDPIEAYGSDIYEYINEALKQGVKNYSIVPCYSSIQGMKN